MFNISNIQHFSVGDGEGIRTTVFFKGCNLRCPWCHNPENLTAHPAVLQYRSTGRTETLGRLVSAEEILPELLEDQDFYNESNGGVTFSGGEAMLQASELVSLARILKENGISVLVDTAGCVNYSSFQKLNPFVAGYLFDFKTAEEDKYQEILAEQREWIATKEAEVKAAGAEYEGGSMQPMVMNMKAAELTKARVYELLEYFGE